MSQKLTLGAMILALSSTAFASGLPEPMPAPEAQFSPGLYLGIQGGWAKANFGSGLRDYTNDLYDIAVLAVNEAGGSAAKDVQEGGFGGRAYVGYQFIPYLGLELGYDLFPNNKYTFAANINGLTPYSYYAKTKSYAFDLMLKGVLPLDEMSMTGWNLFAKVGAAYVHSSMHFCDTIGVDINKSKNALALAYGAGIGYNFNENFGMDLSYAGILGKDKFKEGMAFDQFKAVPTTNMVTLGLSYKFSM